MSALSIEENNNLTVEQVVEKGVQLLNKQRPNWFEQINIDDLYMASCERCILGQLFGNYQSGVTTFGMAGQYTIQEQHGFEASRGIWYGVLKTEWIRRIKELQTKRS